MGLMIGRLWLVWYVEPDHEYKLLADIRLVDHVGIGCRHAKRYYVTCTTTKSTGKAITMLTIT